MRPGERRTAEGALTPEDALGRAAEAGIHRLQIPTPFAVGRVNCYLIEDDPLTLVDTGPNSGKSLDELEQQLSALGRSLEDIELVILSHQHIDHLGLVEIIASRSGAAVAAIDVVVPFVENFGDDVELDDQFAASLMLRHGIPEDVVTALRSVSRSFRAWGARAKVTRPLHDAEELRLRDRALEVQHRPGHSPSDTVFWDEERVPSVGLRPFIVYGPGRDAGLTASPSLAMAAAARAEDFRIAFGGRTQLQFAPDAGRVFVAAARAATEEARVFHLGGPAETIEECAAAIEESAPGVTVEWEAGTLPFPEEFDGSALEAALGPISRTPLREGVRQTVDRLRAVPA